MADSGKVGSVQGNGQTPDSTAKLLSDGANPFAMEALHLREIFGILRRRYPVVLAVTFVMVAGAAFWLWARPRQYQATAAILIVDARRSLAGPILSEQTGRGVGRLTDPIRSHMQVLEGRTVLGKVVEREGLRLVTSSTDFPRHLLSAVAIADSTPVDVIELNFTPQHVIARTRVGEVRARYGQRLEMAGVGFVIRSAPASAAGTLRVLSREDAIDELTERLHVLPRTGTDVIEISYTSTDPVAAQRVVNAVAEVFQLYNLQMVQQQTTLRRVFLENQLRTTEAELSAANQALNNFRQSRQIYRPAEQLSGRQQALMSLDIERSQIEADRGMYRSLLEALQASATGERGGPIRTLVSAPGIASNPVISQLYTQLMTHEADRDALTTGPLGSTPANPDVERLKRLISATEEKLVRAIQSHVASLEARVAALDELRARKLAEMQELPRAETEEARLLQNISTISSLADAIRADLERSRMAEAIETGQVEILNLAPPGQPIHAARRKRLILATILGLMFGGGAAFALEFMDGTIRRRRDIEGIVKLPCLAVIPPLRANGNHRRHALSHSLRHAKRRPGTVPPIVTTAAAANTGGAEAFRRLRNNLFLAARNGSITLMITSPAPEEGKTFTAANLAVAVARQGKRVLVVDADLKRPSMDRVFEVALNPGIAEVLLGEVAAADAVRNTGIVNLSVLTAGQQHASLYDAFQKDALSDLMTTLVGRFDVIILDTPPVMAAADVMTIATVSDVVLLVLRAGASRPDTAQQAIEELNRVGAHVVGAALADPDGKVLEGSCYEYYAAGRT